MVSTGGFGHSDFSPPQDSGGSSLGLLSTIDRPIRSPVLSLSRLRVADLWCGGGKGGLPNTTAGAAAMGDARSKACGLDFSGTRAGVETAARTPPPRAPALAPAPLPVVRSTLPCSMEHPRRGTRHRQRLRCPAHRSPHPPPVAGTRSASASFYRGGRHGVGMRHRRCVSGSRAPWPRPRADRRPDAGPIRPPSTTCQNIRRGPRCRVAFAVQRGPTEFGVLET